MSTMRRSLLCAGVTLFTSVASGLGCASEAAGPEPLPDVTKLPVVSASDFVAEDFDALDGMARVRVNLITHAGGNANAAVQLDGVRICASDVCFSNAHALRETLGQLRTPSGVTLADISIPDGTFSQLVLESRDHSLQTTLSLNEPLLVEPGHRAEIFVELTSQEGKLAARFAAAGLVSPDAETALLAEPEHALQAQLPHGAELMLARGSVRAATVIGASEQLAGDLAARVQLTPADDLHAPASVKLPLDMARLPMGLSLSDYEVKVSGEKRAMPPMAAGQRIEVALDRLGSVEVSTDRGYVVATDGTAYAPVDDGVVLKAAETCASRLAAHLPGYLTTLKTHAGIRITDCESLAPFVHIVLVNTQMAGMPANLLYPQVLLPVAAKNGDGTYNLRRLTDHASSVGAFAAINGFTWSGSAGARVAPGTGSFIGTTFIEGSLKKSSAAAEAIIGFTRRDNAGVRGTGAKLFAKAANAMLPELPPYHWNAVGSTTSILKASLCTRAANEPNSTNRWSAIGIGAGRLAMVSSTSAKTTTAFALCGVFSSLKSTDATRMDGGPSTAIVYMNTLLNPISTAANPGDAGAFGDARHILHAIAAK